MIDAPSHRGFQNRDMKPWPDHRTVPECVSRLRQHWRSRCVRDV